MLWALFEHLELPRALYLLAITGFLGGFTTFSAFSLDVVSLMRNGQLAASMSCAAVSVIGAIGGCALGLYAMARIIRFIS